MDDVVGELVVVRGDEDLVVFDEVVILTFDRGCFGG